MRVTRPMWGVVRYMEYMDTRFSTQPDLGPWYVGYVGYVGYVCYVCHVCHVCYALQ